MGDTAPVAGTAAKTDEYTGHYLTVAAGWNPEKIGELSPQDPNRQNTQFELSYKHAWTLDEDGMFRLGIRAPLFYSTHTRYIPFPTNDVPWTHTAGIGVGPSFDFCPWVFHFGLSYAATGSFHLQDKGNAEWTFGHAITTQAGFDLSLVNVGVQAAFPLPDFIREPEDPQQSATSRPIFLGAYLGFHWGEGASNAVKTDKPAPTE